jgi:hypothetical protein
MAGKSYIVTDWAASGGEPLKHHQVALALLLALGAPDPRIFELLPGLTPGQLSMLRSNRILTSAVSSFREEFLGENAQEQFQAHLPKAFAIMTEALNAESNELKLKDRFEAAKWLMEKVTGKARQELEVAAGGSLLTFLRELDRLKVEREVSPAALALTHPAAKEKSDPIDDWVTHHITKETR